MLSNNSVRVIEFRRLEDAKAYIHIIVPYLDERSDESDGADGVGIVVDVDDTLLTGFNPANLDEVNTVLDIDEPRRVAQHSGDQHISVRLPVTDLVAELARAWDAQIHVVSARPAYAEAAIDLSNDLRATAEPCFLPVGEGGRVASMSTYPLREFGRNDHLWAFKEGLRMSARKFTRCRLEVGDRCWDCMHKELMCEIDAALGEKDYIDDPDCRETFVILTYSEPCSFRIGLKLPKPSRAIV